jgi:hypothetical protein
MVCLRSGEYSLTLTWVKAAGEGAAALRTGAESPERSGTKCSEARTCSGWPGPKATPKHYNIIMQGVWV